MFMFTILIPEGFNDGGECRGVQVSKFVKFHSFEENYRFGSHLILLHHVFFSPQSYVVQLMNANTKAKKQGI